MLPWEATNDEDKSEDAKKVENDSLGLDLGVS